MMTIIIKKVIKTTNLVGGDNVASIEWMCKKCGKKQTLFEATGRPQPGKCPKNNNKEHAWVKNRKI